jgi:exonuclease VII large subunit
LGNKLFQLARDAVLKAEEHLNQAASQADIDEAINYVEEAKNNLSSAFANSTEAERNQLQQYQDQLNKAVDHQELQ